MTTYEPRGGARKLLLSREPTVLISGPAGTGKTVAALFKIHLTSLMVPNCVSLVLRATHASLTASTLRTYEQFVAHQEIASGEVVWFGGSGSKPAAYRYKNGSLIIPGGMDQPGKFLSMDVQRIVIDECNQVSQTGVETVQTRLRGNAATYRQALLLTNPDHPEHHLLKMAQEGGAEHITSLHVDNPYLFDRSGSVTVDGKDYLTRLETLTGIRRARYYEGRWLAAEGTVWDGWQDAVHLIDSFPVPGDWRTVWSWDQGFQNPQVFQRWAVDPDGRAYLTHEMSRRQRLVEDFAKDILELKKANGWDWPEAFVADHDSGDRATMAKYLGRPTLAARKAVGPGVQAVAQRLVVQRDGKPRLFVFRDALIRNDPLAATDKRPRGFAAEVNGYVWAMERGVDGVPKEAPLKVNDHSCDAARYLVMYLDGAPPAKLGNPAAPQQGQQSRDSQWSRPTGKPNG